ncbi:long-chain-fatty-acid--CoA ligase [Kroppenstedtia sanguinis]|uniref:Long-chain fatty acid--CoA ligase n=1 Tax=Kroppenstedtia sanguinis TaxID=1380684 RepID=A0ABW4C8A4_9BACL
MAVKERIWFKNYPEAVPQSLEYPDQPLPELLEKSAQEFPEREAIYFMGKRISYRELTEDVYRMARALKELGVKKGDRVSLMLANTPQAVISYYAVLKIGGVVVQTNPMYKERELEHLLADSGAETIICMDLVYPQVEKVKPRTCLKRVLVTGIQDYLPFPKNWLYSLKLKMDGAKPKIPYGDEVFAFSEVMKQAASDPVKNEIASMDEVALLQYTGGTTGLAKGAMLTHRNLVVNVIQCSYWMYKGERGQEKVLGLVPFFHVYGMTVVMNFSIYMAASMVLVPRFDVKDVLKVIDRERPSFFPGAPTMYVALINHPEVTKYDLSSIQACISGSAPLPLAIQEKFEKLTGGRLVEGYGLTECSPVTHANPIWDKRKNGSIGLPWPDTECRVVDPDRGEEVEAGMAGLLHVKGPQVMKGYWNQPEETDKVLREGWLNTGDIAMMDEDGYFYIMDRQKDMIIAGGFNIYPREVEEVLYDHPAVQEVAVIGVPDPYRGETVKAYLVLKPDAQVTEKELNTYCRSKLANFKVPRLYEFRDQLPKTTVGKVLRRELVEEEKRKASVENPGGE